MKLKRCLAVFVGLALCAAPLMAGGSSESSGGGSGNSGQIDLRCASGSIGGSFYIMAAAIASVVNKNVPGVNIAAQTTSGSNESYIGVVNKDFELCVTNNDFPYIGAHGGDPARPTYVNGPNVRTWLVVEPSPHILIARADASKVTTYRDIIKSGVKIGLPAKGSTGYNLLINAVEVMGGDFSKIDQYNAGHEQTASALKDGNVDVAFTMVGFLSAPNTAYQEFATATDIAMFDVPEDVRTGLNQRMPYWGKVTLQPDWLPGLKKQYQTVGIYSSFLLDESVPEELVYQMTKALFENLDDLKSIAFTAFRNLGPDTAAVEAACPIHPGALRYYKEQGFKIDVRP
ncbi:MAG: TAXI family TRAP transporter solute-binding subunit [Spirochaetales bacterium]|jgi:TRAP transporter TAXI family solute receptor|nr:TAXI family TRAP transporter solute-binding subunit [Spirochaetales bacterium]